MVIRRIDLKTLYEQEEYREAIIFFTSYVEDFISKTGERPKYFIKTYGCQMNEHDSERLRWIFNEIGYGETFDENQSDVILYNTCLIRENAENKVFGKIGALKHLKKKKPNITIIMCGCMMEKEELRLRVKEKYSQVDIVFGTNALHRLPLLLYRHLLGGDFISDESENGLLVDNIGMLPDSPFQSYVNITYGCNNFCTYCVVPFTRGREMSRLKGDIISEVEELAKKGTKEVTLLGQNVNSYGNTFENDYRFADLLTDIDKIGIDRIRFMTSHPKDISDRLIECFITLKHLPHYIHLPVQSGSNKILKAMNRHYTIEKYLQSIDKLKKAAPDIAISTDIIVGFPGETEEDFNATMELSRIVGYDSSFSFIFSKRQGTVAYNMENQISEEVKSERHKRLNSLLNDISLKKNLEFVGREEEILVEAQSKSNPDMLTGRTLSNKLVHFRGTSDMIGKFVVVRIENAKSFSLEGDFIGVADR